MEAEGGWKGACGGGCARANVSKTLSEVLGVFLGRFWVNVEMNLISMFLSFCVCVWSYGALEKVQHFRDVFYV